MLPIPVFICALILWWLWGNIQRAKDFPPGPAYWPIVGNLPQLAWLGRGGKHKHLLFKQLADEYGDIVGLKVLSDKMVIVSGKEIIKEVASRDEFLGRPDGFIFLYRSFGEKLGIGFNEGDTWAEQRRFALKIFREFGLGKSSMETSILQEISHLIDAIKLNSLNEPVETDEIFIIPIFNIVWMIVAGYRFSPEDKKIRKILDVTKNMLIALGSGGNIFLNQFPWIRHIIPESIGFSDLEKHSIEVKKFFNDSFDEHKTTLNPNSPRDFIDSYLIEMDKSEGRTTTFTKNQLMIICDDFLAAGTDTTSNSLSFFVLYMIKYPEVQKKIQNEIDTAIGNGRSPALKDRPFMPYTEATIMETTRLSPVLPLLVPRKAMTTTRLQNYTIEKGTTLIVSLHNLHLGSCWKDPLEFRPERFIAEDGKVIQDENLLPFGLGKRRCMGEIIAKSTLFLFVVSLLQKFDLKSPDDEPPPSLESVDGFTQSPKPFKTLFTLRGPE